MRKKEKIARDWEMEKVEDWPALMAYMAENLVNASGYNPSMRKVLLWDGRTLVKKPYLGIDKPDFSVNLKKKDITEGLNVFLGDLLEKGCPFKTNGFIFIGHRKLVTHFEWTIIP
jgi:hypothetical protein